LINKKDQLLHSVVTFSCYNHHFLISILVSEVTREPKEVAESQILEDLRATSLKQLPELYIIGALRSPLRKTQITELVAWQASCSWFTGSNRNSVHNFFKRVLSIS